MDVLTREQRRYCMSKIKGVNTKPEVALRKFLWNLGYRYRIRSRLPGRPDLVFPSFRAVVFVDGCFWHKCSAHFVQPKTRTQFWMDKINSNVERDQRNNEALRLQGWQVIRVWEHEVEGCLEGAVARVVEALENQRRSFDLEVVKPPVD